ncbi:MAG: D-aminoacyl-tRNA deacylase [Rhodocyclaceae bacterium]|jgi:D-aminoacyl-tRNA deacylase
MIALIQRVRECAVRVDGEVVGEIGQGLLALVAIQREDSAEHAQRMLDKLLKYRVFGDDEGRMNRSLSDIGGGLMLVSQFTLAADTKKGTRPSFTRAAEPAMARELFDYLVGLARVEHAKVATGRFAADMQVSLVNDGPVTFWLEV